MLFVPGSQSTNFREPVQQLTQAQVEQMQLKYYNSDMHRAAFVLPEFTRKVSGLPGSLLGLILHSLHILLTDFMSHQALNDIS